MMRGIDDMNTRNTKENTKEEIDTTTPKIPPRRSLQITVKSNITAGGGPLVDDQTLLAVSIESLGDALGW